MAKGTKKTTLILFLLRLFRMAITVLTVTFSAKYFGVSMEKDIWVLTLTIISTVIGAVWGPINEVFRTKFIYIKEQEGADMALKKTASLVSFIIGVSLVIAILLFLFSPFLSEYMTHNMQAGASGLFVILLLLLLPTLLINELINIGISILNAYDVYYIPETIGFASGIINLFAIIFFANVIGIYSCLIGTYIGNITLLVVILHFLKKKQLTLWHRFHFFSWSDVKVFLLFAMPFFFPYFIGQFNALFEKFLAGMLGSGNISSVEYARQFITVLQGVLSSVLTTIMVPMLAKQYINSHNKEFERTLIDNLMISMLIYVTASVFLLGSTTPLCDFFFNRGKVTGEELANIITLTRSYGLAFWGVIIYLITGMALLASNKGKIYASIGVTTQIVVLGLNYLLCPTYGVNIFPLSLGIAHLTTGMVMLKYVDLVNRRTIIVYLIKSMAVVLCVSLAFHFFNDFVGYNISLLRLIVVTCIYGVIIPIIASLLGFDVKLYFNKIVSKIRQ